VIFLVLAALAVGELFTVNKMNTLRDQLTTQQDQMREDLTGQFRSQVSDRLSAIERQNAQELGAVRTELDGAAKRVGAQGGELRRARAMVTQLQNQQSAQGVGLTLKKTNPKRHQFNVATLADDMEVERKDCAINAPVYFYVNGSKKPYELVVNRVESNQVKGYISTRRVSPRLQRARREHVSRNRGETLSL